MLEAVQHDIMNLFLEDEQKEEDRLLSLNLEAELTSHESLEQHNSRLLSFTNHFEYLKTSHSTSTIETKDSRFAQQVERIEQYNKLLRDLYSGLVKYEIEYERPNIPIQKFPSVTELVIGGGDDNTKTMTTRFEDQDGCAEQKTFSQILEGDKGSTKVPLQDNISFDNDEIFVIEKTFTEQQERLRDQESRISELKSGVSKKRHEILKSKAEENRFKCVDCRNHVRKIFFMECHHLLYCESCFERRQSDAKADKKKVTCPLDGKTVHRYQKVFL
eukprot:CAMPEP_0115017502 /NCGR_PEP_ID=MMETSP0216-20121206/28169_1 /TAXON_ID=223996 /ORGANISM="Protocruzia adherens, Strain Boccale" /LENGTH=273 /DNA_ID=CAMNT_0002388359 /DNA_START=79 /DNA_END=900 /DNA_ORIENTATION=-